MKIQKFNEKIRIWELIIYFILKPEEEKLSERKSQARNIQKNFIKNLETYRETRF